jgi:hypothetical protein
VNNIKMNLGEIGCGGMDWTGLAEDRNYILEGSCVHGNELSVSIKFWADLEWLKISCPLEKCSARRVNQVIL